MKNPPLLHQHDLQPAIAQQLVDSLGLTSGERVFEPGPGHGALTIPLLRAGALVSAVEIDPARVASLSKRAHSWLSDGQLQLHHLDARGFFPWLEGPWRLVANPPFQHTAELLESCLLEHPPAAPPLAIDVVLQWQTAVKLVGTSDHWSRSSILWQLSGSPQVERRLRRVDVEPPARVDLAWFSWRRAPDAPSAQRLRLVNTLLQQGFRGDHSVRSALRGLTTPAILRRQSRLHHWQPDGPARALSPQAWLSLADFLGEIGKL